MAIAEPDELQESVGPGADGYAWQGGDLPAIHRASQYALEAPRIAIALSDDLRERERPGYDDVCSRAEAQQSVAAAELRS